MKLFYSTSGGLFNRQMKGEIDTDDLEPERAKEVEEHLSESRLSKAKVEENPNFADGQQISLRVSSVETSRQVDLDEASTEPELFHFFRELIQEIEKGKMK